MKLVTLFDPAIAHPPTGITFPQLYRLLPTLLTQISHYGNCYFNRDPRTSLSPAKVHFDS